MQFLGARKIFMLVDGGASYMVDCPLEGKL